MNKNNDYIPSGSEVPGQSGETLPVEATPVEAPPEPSKSLEAMETELKSTQDQLANAQKTMGKHSNEVGELRQSVKALSEQLESKKDPEASYDDLEAGLFQQFEDGDLDSGQYARELSKLSRQRASTEAQEAIRTELEQRDNRDIQENFLKQNPDYEDLVSSGSLDEFKAANPMHDNMSAYYEFKAKEAGAQATQAEEARKTAEEAQKAGKVLGKQGEGVRDKTPAATDGSRSGVKQAMLDALRNKRASG